MSAASIIGSTLYLAVPILVLTFPIIKINNIAHRIAARVLSVEYMELYKEWVVHLHVARKMTSLSRLTKSLSMKPGASLNFTFVASRDSFEAAPLWKKCVILLSGPIACYIFAFVVLCSTSLLGIQKVTNKVASVEKDSPAEMAEIKVGDEIIAIQDYEVDDLVSFIKGLQEVQEEENIKITLQNEKGMKRETVVTPELRDGQVPHFGITFDIGRETPSLTAIFNLCYQTVYFTVYKIFYFFTHLSFSDAKQQNDAPGLAILLLSTMALSLESIGTFLTAIALLSMTFATINLVPIPVTATGRILYYGIMRVMPALAVPTARFYWYNAGFSFFALSLLLFALL